MKMGEDIEIPLNLQKFADSYKAKIGGTIHSIKWLGGSTNRIIIKINNIMYEFDEYRGTCYGVLI